MWSVKLTLYYHAAQVAEYPFDSDLKRMSVLYERNGYVTFNRDTGVLADALTDRPKQTIRLHEGCRRAHL